jgi:phosphinothricin acetyltransferase
MPPFVIRPAAADDFPAVREIYNFYVANSTCTYQLEPDPEDVHRNWFTDRGPAHPVIVAEAGGEVVGWGALSPWNKRAGYARTVEASVYVRHDAHRRGIGRALLVELIDLARALGHHTILGGTSADQPASLALQEALGFVRVGLLREVGVKFGRRLDVILTQRML